MSLIKPIRNNKNPLLQNLIKTGPSRAEIQRQRSLDLALSLEHLAPQINSISEDNVLLNLQFAKEKIMQVATEVLENEPKFLVRIKANLGNILSKSELQKYMYNMILRGHKLGIK